MPGSVDAQGGGDDARASTRHAAKRVAANMETTREEAQAKWAERIARIKNGNK